MPSERDRIINTTDEKVGMNTVSHTQDEVNAREIQVEDPVNFLNLQEKQEYMLAHQDTIARGEVPLDKLSDLPVEKTLVSSEPQGRPPYSQKPQEQGMSLTPKNKRPEEYERRTSHAVIAERQEVEEVRYRDYDDRSGLERGLAAAVKLGLVVIVILLLTMLIFLFLPSIKRAIGMTESGDAAGAGVTLPQEDLFGSQSPGQPDMQASQPVNPAIQEQPAEEPVTETPTASPDERTVTVMADTLNLRDLPGWMEGSEVICKAAKGEQLTVIGEQDGWLKVRYNGQELFCSEEYVE